MPIFSAVSDAALKGELPYDLRREDLDNIIGNFFACNSVREENADERISEVM